MTPRKLVIVTSIQASRGQSARLGSGSGPGVTPSGVPEHPPGRAISLREVNLAAALRMGWLGWFEYFELLLGKPHIPREADVAHKEAA